MKKALRTIWMRAIKYSLPRFFSILFLVALGVAFFAGVRATEPDMQITVDRQYDDKNFMDIRVLSTQGLTDGDVKALEQLDGVKKAEPTHSIDVLCDIGESEVAIKVYEEPQTLNQLHLEEGSEKIESGECLIDARFAEENGVKIGDFITLKSGNKDDLKDSLHKDTYQIKGLVSYNYYLTRDRGTTTIGNGKIEGYLVIPAKDFSMDVYTEIYVQADGAKGLTTHTDEYEDKIDGVVDSIEKIKEKRETIRYQEIKEEAQEKVDKAKKKYQKEKKKAEKKLSDAKDELDQAKKKLDSSEKQLKQAKSKLDSGNKQLKSGKKEYENGKKQLASGQKQYKNGLSQYQKGLKEYNSQKKKMDDAKSQLDQAVKAYGITYAQLDENYGELYQQYQTYLAGKKQLDSAKKKLDKSKKTLDASKRKLKTSEKQLKNAKQKLEQSEKELKRGQTQYNNGIKSLATGKKEYENGLSKYKKEKKKAEKEFKKTEKKLKDAQKKVDELEKGEWYVLDRNKIQSYVEFGQDSERIGAIGKVFPLIFFLVAALVSLTTMTRMVEEERVQLGTMKALGYSKIQIAAKYLLYASLATVFGSLLGAVSGEIILPKVIITAYTMMYVGVYDVATPLHANLALLAAVAAFITTIGATLLSSYRALAEVPAQLMRPEAPKGGKRVFLEYIPFLWRKISFSWKSSIRNLVRYKKRFFMTIFGIGGCMALLLVGFGLKDSIFATTNNQYTKIRTYDVEIGFDEDENNKTISYILQQKGIQSGMEAKESSVDIENKTGSKTASLVIPSDKETITQLIQFRDRVSGDRYPLTDDGVIITEKLATMLEIKVGDTITIKEGDTKKVKAKVTAIAENYLRHYVFMSDQQYTQLYGEKPAYNKMFCKTTSRKSSFEDALSKKMLKKDGITSVSFVSATEKEMDDMLGNLNIVVWILIISAGLLAFVVLYNLNNINIEERRRELATIKVLGFYQSELAAYVYRENVMLTLIGTFAGVFLGIALHRYVILTAEVDAIMFGREISLQSYFYSVLLTCFFSIFVNGVMYFKLKKIDMVESLKSVE